MRVRDLVCVGVDGVGVASQAFVENVLDVQHTQDDVTLFVVLINGRIHRSLGSQERDRCKRSSAFQLINSFLKLSPSNVQ